MCNIKVNLKCNDFFFNSHALDKVLRTNKMMINYNKIKKINKAATEEVMNVNGTQEKECPIFKKATTFSNSHFTKISAYHLLKYLKQK